MQLILLILPLLFFVPSFGMELIGQNNPTKKCTVPPKLKRFALIPKEITFSEIIPRLSGDTGFNLAMTCKDSYSKLCNTHQDKIRLLSWSIPLELDIHRKALVFYAQQFNNTNNLSIKKDCEEFIITLIENEGGINEEVRNQVLTAFNKNDSAIDTIELYGRDYSKNNSLAVNIPPTLLTEHDLYVLKLLCAQKFDPNTKNNVGDTLLHGLASDDSPTGVEYLLNHFKIDLNIQNNEGNTPLHCTTNNATVECAKYLFHDFSSNPNIQNNDGDTPLHLFATHNNTEGIALLLDSVNNDDFISDNLDDLLFKTLKFLNPKQLLRINPNIKNKRGETPLHLASEHGTTESMKLILQYYAIDPNTKNKKGNTPVHCVIENNKGKHLKILLRNSKTDPNIKNTDGNTPIHCAIKNNNTKLLRILLSNPATDPNIKDKDRNTPLHKAVQEKRIKCIKYLLKDSKTDPNIKDKDGDTPFDCLSLYNLSEKEEIHCIKLFIANPKTKLSWKDKAYVYLLRKAGKLN